MHFLRNPFLVSLLLVGCASAPVPMRQVSYLTTQDAKCLVVLLPGMGDRAEDFDTHGLVQSLRDAGLSADVIAANATSGYYFRGVLVERLFEDVIRPARAAHAYSHVWLMGASMGGFGSFFYPSQREVEIDGVFGMAAFLGDRAVLEEIRAQGGLSTWHAPQKVPATDDTYQRQLWRFLQETTRAESPRPQLFIGWGVDDRLREADALLGDALPRDHVFTAAGGHAWKTWNVLLDAFLAEGTFKKQCAMSPAN